jgi:hypothetical protein
MKYLLVALSLIFVSPAFACGDPKAPTTGGHSFEKMSPPVVATPTEDKAS